MSGTTTGDVRVRGRDGGTRWWRRRRWWRRHGLLDERTYRRTVQLLADLVLGPVAFTVAVVGVSLAAGLALTVVGLPLLVAVLSGARGLARLEQVRLRVLLDAVPRESAAAPATANRGWQFWRRLADADSWLALLYLLLLLPVGLLTGTVALTLWSLAVAGLAYPVWAPLVGDAALRMGSVTLTGAGAGALAVTLGVVAALLAPTVVRWLASVDLTLARVCRLVS